MVPPTGYNLVWSDEFNGTSLDNSKWSIAYGSASVSNSILTLGPNAGEIIARTIDPKISKFKFVYGYVETKMKFAFDPQNPTTFRRTHRTGYWLANAPEHIDYDRSYTWGGEIDITETGSGSSINDNTACGSNKINTSIHRFLNSSPYLGPNYISMTKTYTANFNLSAAFHILGCEWTKYYIRTILDGTEVLRIKNTENPIPEAYMYPILGICPRCWPLQGPDNPYVSPCPSDIPTGREIAQVDYIRIYEFGTTCAVPSSTIKVIY